GLFATKLSEFNRTNFTGSFQAHKSAFCVGNKIICLGTNIDNGNNSYPTETTLFQQSLLSPDEALNLNNEAITAFPLDRTEGSNGNTVLKDLTGNYYYVPQGQDIKIVKSLQASKKNTDKTNTQGNYATVYLNHGNAPKSKDYEYMISLEPSNEEVNSLMAGTKGYTVIQKDANAHIVNDISTNVTAYACFEALTTTNDKYLLASDRELMIMIQPQSNGLAVSVCDPYLNQSSYSYTNAEESRPITKSITLKGKWILSNTHNNVTTTINNGNTTITVTCQHGQPVEFYFNNNATEIDIDKDCSIDVYTSDSELVVKSQAGNVIGYGINGIQLFSFDKEDGLITYPLNEYKGEIIVKVITSQKVITRKVIF
ncbi:MAG: polysaccharide lyase family 8 super-sandwich domain-containing protein, partial [Bacteroidaceae bacterium]